MSEVVPLPSFGEVFFDARGQERCLRVTWHEGTLVLSLWRGEMCTASFRMPMEDVGRLLDTLDEGFAEATGEQPAVPAQDPGTEIIPGTGQYHRPPQHAQQPPPAPQQEERQAASLSPTDVLVARGNPPQDKLVASYSETTAPRDTTPAYGDHRPFTGPQYVEPNQYTEQPAPQYEQTGPQRAYTGDPFSGPQPAYTGDPFSGPQYTGDPLSGPHYAQPDSFTGPQYSENEPVYQMPGDQRRSSPLSTDPLGFPSQAADPYQSSPARSDAYPPYPSDPYGSRGSEAYEQPQPSAAGLGTPMHGIPGAGRPRPPIQQRQQPAQPARDDYAPYQTPPPNPVDPLLALGRQEYTPQPGRQADPSMSRPYIGDPMFSTGERLRPEQQDHLDGGDRREW
ncbi:hypothetical protein E1286_20820 [Nonomuraea terrae]|uniref:Uncharacterized protein n=1 Tax=Nonomuraea terrae TaxID=2530383 RepID=A0A4V2YLJ8_9ACTN|nr:hypothetical protein [Nonomuraea terrae]TDD46427.1 hypothetical protein E1286_20820 [Nonomuraea terrae]